MLITDARKAVQDGASPAEVEPLTSELQQLLYGLAPAPTGDSDGHQVGDATGTSSDDDVIDAEFDRS